MATGDDPKQNGSAAPTGCHQDAPEGEPLTQGWLPLPKRLTRAEARAIRQAAWAQARVWDPRYAHARAGRRVQCHTVSKVPSQ